MQEARRISVTDHPLKKDGALGLDSKNTRTESMFGRDIAHREIKSAEAKVAVGIGKLYRHLRHKQYVDPQGLAIVELKPNDAMLTDEIKHAFPNQLKNGITVLYMKRGYVQFPPLRYMIRQKIKSLYAAATTCYGLLPESEAAQKALITDLEAHLAQFKPIRDLFKAQADRYMRFYIKQSVRVLYQLYCAKQTENGQLPDGYKRFLKNIFATSQLARASTASILTFDEALHQFSFDEGAEIAAHDRSLDQSTANLSWVCDGVWTVADDKQSFTMLSSTVKHASLAPIDAFKAKNPPSSTDIVMSTYAHMKEVVAKLVAIRVHGRRAEMRDQPMEVNWVYHLVTSNMLNKDQQALSYGYIVRAGQLLDGNRLTIPIDDTLSITVIPSIYVLNAGINQFGGDSLFQKDKFERENTKAYFYLSHTLQSAINITELLAQWRTLFEGKYLLFPKEYKAVTLLLNDLSVLHTKINYLPEKYRGIKQWLAENNNHYFQPLVDLLPRSQDPAYFEDELKSIIRRTKNENHTLGELQHEIKKQVLVRFDAVLATQINAALHFLGSQPGKDLFNKLITLQSDPAISQQQRALLEKIVFTLIVYVYKNYMDRLYYSGDYQKDPKNAALFHLYSMAFEYLLGITNSVGCKSANDRTYVMRLFFAALHTMMNNQLLLPPDLQRAERYQHFVRCLDGLAMSHAALFSCIDDTAGGPPKISSKRGFFASYYYLDGITGLKDKACEALGDYAPHKMLHNKTLISEILEEKLPLKAARSSTQLMLASMPVVARRQPEEMASPSNPLPPVGDLVQVQTESLLTTPEKAVMR